MEAVKFSIIIITYAREDDLYLTLECFKDMRRSDTEILLLDNNTRDIGIEKYIKENIILNNFTYYKSSSNLGVARGRNYLIDRSKGEFIITLDDDVFIKDANDLIFKTEEYFKANSKVSCLCYNIINYHTKKKLRKECPHYRKNIDWTKNQIVSYYIGAGNAIRKSIIEKVGSYPDDFGVYGMEEIDLSFRINSISDILYVADIEVFHKISPYGRLSNFETLKSNCDNRIKIAIKYFPVLYVLSAVIIWTSYYMIKSRKIYPYGDMKATFCKFFEDRKYTKFTSGQIKKIKTSGARLWY